MAYAEIQMDLPLAAPTSGTAMDHFTAGPFSGLPRAHFACGYIDPPWLAMRGRGYRRQSQGGEQVLHAPLREHSRKPDEIAARIEQLIGDLPEIELFARTRRPGWTCWGDEVDLFDGGTS